MVPGSAQPAQSGSVPSQACQRGSRPGTLPLTQGTEAQGQLAGQLGGGCPRALLPWRAAGRGQQERAEGGGHREGGGMGAPESGSV